MTARRIRMDLSEAPETARDSQVGGDLNLSVSSWTQDREDDCREKESPLTTTAPAAAVPGPVALEETSPDSGRRGAEGGWSRLSSHSHRHHLLPGQSIFHATISVSCVLFVLPVSKMTLSN